MYIFMAKGCLHMFLLGEILAAGVSVCDAACCSLLNSVEARISTFTINFVKLVAAALFVFLLRLALAGTAGIPLLPAAGWLWLAASGLIGYVLGDMMFIGSFRHIPYRLSMVIYYTNPVVTTLAAFLLFGQRVTVLQLCGIVLTIGGTALALLFGSRRQDEGGRRLWKRGLLLAFLAMLAQGANVLMSMRAADLLGELPGKTLLCSQIRQLAGLLGFGVYGLVRGFLPRLRKEIRGRAMARIALGGIAGNGLGPVLLLQSLQYVPAGISTALASLSPLLVIPVSVVLFHDHIRFAEILGACITVAGVILLSV